MDNTLLKQELHQLIEACDNELLLQQARNILLSDNVKDWWDELIDDDNDSPVVSGLQFQQGDVQLLQQIEPWSQK